MSFSINPAFSFSLNRILVGSVKFGKYDGIHVCLTAVTSTDKVILHNPYKKLSESNNRLSWAEASSDIAVLNFNQEIRAIETGCLSEDPKDILVIGSPTQLLGRFSNPYPFPIKYDHYHAFFQHITLTITEIYFIRRFWKVFSSFLLEKYAHLKNH